METLKIPEEKFSMFFTKTSQGKSFARHRTAAVKGFMSHDFSFHETLALILPARLSPLHVSLMPRYRNFLKEKSEEEISSFMEKNYPGMFQDIDGEDRFEFAYEIVVMDQYNFKRFLKPDSIVISAGANIGVASIFASRLASSGRVYVFEPVRKTFDILKKNVRGFSGIFPFNEGLGDKEKDGNILTSSRSSGMNAMSDSVLAVTNKKYFDGTERVHTTTIDYFVKKQNIPRVDFIKIDTEGYEAKILTGATETIKKWKPTIAMSAYHMKDDKKDLPELLKEICADYVCELHSDAEEDLICYVKK